MRTGDVRGERMPTRERPPLVGRDAERADLAERLAAGRHVLLEGPAGVGKSRLAEEVLRAPDLARRAVDRLLACAGTTGVALAAMLPLVAGRAARDGLGSQIEWYLGRWRAGRASGEPTVVWVDDVHHLDDVSAALIRQAVAAGDIQLFGTVRARERVPDDLLALLVDGTVERVHLSPLDLADARRLATLCTPDPPSTDQVERITRLAAGYPLFVRELALSGGPGSLPPDGPGRALLRDRLDRLAPDARRTAELVALAQPVPAVLLAGRERMVDALAHAGLVVTQERGLVRLDHPLQAEWLVDELGPARVERYRELAERADETPGLVDALVAVEWRLAAEQPLDPAHAAYAVRLALARTDARAARRLLAHVTDEHDLLLGQTLAIEGDLDRGLELLERVRREAPNPALRVEAASLLVRHLGLTRSDYARAHDVLDRTETAELGIRLRRILLLGRLWLRLFGPDLGPRITPSHELLAESSDDVDQLAYDLATSSTSLFCQTVGTAGAARFLERVRTVERAIEVDEGSWCRARAVEIWWHAWSGDLVSARRTVAAGLRRAWAQGWQEGFRILAGNGALVGALAGEPRPDFLPPGWHHHTLDPGGLADSDFYRLRALAAAAWKACCVLADPADRCPCREVEPADSGGAMPLLDAMVARAETLAAASRGVSAPDALPDAVRLLSENDMQGWLATFYLDGCDLASPDALHRHVAGRLAPAGTWIFARAREAARARAETDPAALLAVGTDLLARGFVVPATRVLADVARMVPDPETRLRAVRGLATAHTPWRGAPMWWIADVEGLPTPRQLEIARAVTGGASVQAVADRWCLSRRTVENHAYRVARSLGARSRDELGDMLAHPCPGLAWHGAPQAGTPRPR